MARSRRRTGKRRMRGDWVYRGEEFEDNGAPLGTQVASYTGAIDRASGAYTLTVGTPVGMVLYDSQDYLTQGTRVLGPATGRVGFLGNEARAQGKRPTILGVDIEIWYQPSAWTVGANFAIGTRVVVCDQNLQTGGLDLPAGYNMTGAAAARVSSSVWANGWGNLWENYRYVAFSTGNETQRWVVRGRWRGRITLPSSACLGIIMLSAPPAVGSTTLRVTPMCRSLVSDPNAG